MNESNNQSEAILKGKVAVITGAASGIGLAIAMQAGRYGMKVVLADIETGALNRAVEQVKSTGAEAIGILTDVTDADSVHALNASTQEVFGPAWLVVNNAGVAKLGLGWQLSLEEWQWVINVNLFGVINGLLDFLPDMVRRDEGYIVNTASAAGLIGVPGGAPYVASKHAVIGLSESIYRELRAIQSPVGITVLCPAAVNTKIVFAERNRPGQPHFEAPDNLPPLDIGEPVNVIEPDVVARQVFDGVLARRFWVLPHANQIGSAVLARARQCVDEHNPDAASMDRISALLHGIVTGIDFVGDSAP